VENWLATDHFVGVTIMVANQNFSKDGSGEGVVKTLTN